MRAILGIILVVSFLMMILTAEQVSCVFVLSFVAFAVTAIKFINHIKA